MQPVALDPVPYQLTCQEGAKGCKFKQPRCELAPGRQDYTTAEVVAYAQCWKAGAEAIHARLTGLQRAVRAREQIAAKAVKASKGS